MQLTSPQGSEELARFLRTVNDRAEELGLTRTDIAERSGLSRRRVVALLGPNPPAKVSTETLGKLAKATQLWLVVDGLPAG